MVTVVVLGIIVSMAAPNISNQMANQRVKSTAATLANALKEAKVESVIRRQPLTLSYDDNNKVINIQHIVAGTVKNTIASYHYNARSNIKTGSSSSSSIEFKPSKTADATTYTICDSNVSASPKQIVVNAIATITNQTGGSCP